MIRSSLAGFLLLLILLTSAGAASAALVNQPMTGSTAPGWVIGGSAYLTASTGVDPNGSGWLRLTEPSNDQAGYGYLDASFDITQGAVIQFDYATWGGSGADGYSIYLFDGAYDWSTFSVGASGGSLGYAQKTVAPLDPGLTGGYIGVGIDEFGNYSNPTEGRIGGTGAINNSVAVRGPYNHPSGAYYYLGGSASLAQTLDFQGQTFRPGQFTSQYRKVVIYLTPVAAPNYLRVDVYVQFGANQPLTQVVTGLNVGRPVPATVKVGYGASTGGSTNYHEIRNLVIDPLPTDINLAIAKTVSSPTVAPGGALSYTVTARNYGPSLTPAIGVPITDTMPAQLTGVTWSCAGMNGGVCNNASGSGNINTTANLPFNAAVTYTVSATGNTGALGTVISNTASLAAPAGVTDYSPGDNSASATSTVSTGTVNISGTVYNDNGAGGVAHNGTRDGTEPGATNMAAYYAKVFRSSDLTTAVASVLISATGTYSVAVPAYGTYTVILSPDNSNAFNPSAPANWVYTLPLNYTLVNKTVGNTALTNQNFGIYNGSRVAGKVINDNGANGAAANAYDGIMNASEAGIAGATVTLRNSTGGTTYDSAVTDSNGDFTLFTNTVSATLRIYQTNLSGYISVNYNRGTTSAATTYNIASDFISFAYTQYANYSGTLFSDAPPVTIGFTPGTRSAGGIPAVPLYYAHSFSASGPGSVSFAASSRTQGSWPAPAYFRDANCNGAFDAGDTAISGAITVSAGVPVCMLVQENIAAGAANGTIDAVTTTATFTYTNSVGPVTSSATAIDTTTVASSDLSGSDKDWDDTNGGDQDPGDVLQYTITLTESAGLAASGVSVTDNIPANLTAFTVLSVPPGATNSSTPAGGANGTGYLNITNISVPANGTRTIVFSVKVAPGAAVGSTIINTATVSNPTGLGADLVAPTATVSASAIPATGNKPLYLYGATAYQLSRTPTPGTPAAITLAKGGGSQIWNQSPVLQSNVTLSPTISANVPVPLYLASNSSANRTVLVSLACSSGGTTLSQTRTVALTTTAQLVTFTLPLAAPLTCAAPNYWRLTVQNTTTGNQTRNVLVYPVSGTNRSQVTLPSLNVINVNSTVIYDDTVYPGGTIVTSSSVPPGMWIRIRSTVSDPFGSFDISGARVTITDPGAIVTRDAVAMTQVADSGLATKVYEYRYQLPAGSGSLGNWTIRVDAAEGTEGTVTDFSLDSLPVTLPVITVVKTADKVSANPGEVVTYTTVVTNTGTGTASGVVLTDTLSPFTAFGVASYPGPFQFVDGSGPAASGLTLGTPVYSQQNGTPWAYVPAPTGYDANVINWRIPMVGTMNGWAGGANPYPSFSVNYKVLTR